MPETMRVDDVRYVKELYPRLKPRDEVIERYRDALENLPPIVVARGGVLVDGYHRWQAHIREGATEISADDLGNLADAEIRRESIARNATHGEQLSRADKKRLAGMLWSDLAAADMKPADRTREIGGLLAVSERVVQDWTKDARKAEKEAAQAKAWDLWLDCLAERQIAEQLGVTQPTINEWLIGKRKSAEIYQPPESRQHFDVWQFQQADQDAGQQSYFGALPPQVVENLLWFYSHPGSIVVDPFAGSGTTIEVAKAMGRRVWASDRRGDNYAPYLPIHHHDILNGWPADAPARADLILLDPPYWQQAKGRYSDDPEDLGNQTLNEFYNAWETVIKTCGAHLADGGMLAYIISPTQLDGGDVIDHSTDMLQRCWAIDPQLRIKRRIIVTYQTQQATGQQVEWARENKRLLKLYRDLVVMSRG